MFWDISRKDTAVLRSVVNACQWMGHGTGYRLARSHCPLIYLPQPKNDGSEIHINVFAHKRRGNCYTVKAGQDLQVH